MTRGMFQGGFGRRGRIAVCAAGVASVLLAVVGCNIIGTAYVLAKGPPKTEAMYTLDKNRPTVVFIDDRANVLGRRSLRLAIAESAQKALIEHADLKNVIDARAVMATVAGETSSEPLDIATLGKRVQAEIVVYAVVDSFTISPDGQSFLPQSRFRVKVLDVTKEQPRTWPTEREGKAISTEIPQRQGTAPRSSTDLMKAETRLAERSGVAVARCFYEYETNDRASENR